MEKGEPTLIPEWLKSSGSVTGGDATTRQIASSSSQSDDHVISKTARNKSSVNITDRTTSLYFRRSSSSNGPDRSRSFSSLGRSNRDRDWEKDIYDSHDKEKSILGGYRHRDYSDPDPLGSILPGRFEKDVLRRSQSMISGKRGETWPRKVAADLSNANKSNHNNSNGVLPGGSASSSVHKAAFDRDFPSLGAEERQTAPEVVRVSSPGLTTVIQSLPLGPSAVIGGDGWTSALAEVPVIVGSNGTGGSVQQANPAMSVSVTSSMITSLNMAETLAQGPSRAHSTSQLSSGTQRLEERAIKQSRQLIPMTPSMPKALVLNPSEKAKPKIGQQQNQISSSHLVNHSPRGGPAKSDVSKTSSVGKLHVLKPSREKNGLSPTAKDSSSPTSGSKVANTTVAVAPLVVGSAPLRSPHNNPNLASTECKPALAVLEKRPTSQAQSRSDFFNLVRKKSMTNPSAVPGPVPSVSHHVLDKSDEAEADAAPVTQGRDAPSSHSSVEGSSSEKSGDVASNGDASYWPQEFVSNGKNHSSSAAILRSEEEEAAFLRSLGWEENGDDEGLTEEEISAFYRDKGDNEQYIKSRPSSRILQGIPSKFSVPVNLRMESVGGASSSGFSSSDSKPES